jgi:hypothetical protein
MMKKIRKAKVKQALRQGNEEIPTFKKTDTWDWN